MMDTTKHNVTQHNIAQSTKRSIYADNKNKDDMQNDDHENKMTSKMKTTVNIKKTCTLLEYTLCRTYSDYLFLARAAGVPVVLGLNQKMN